ncbi:MAG TPA: zf-HC2 domain-containing protein [Terriglobia bacterium]|nr:zf-HC2 domain-containing protein [Terriglobia bacterium]
MICDWVPKLDLYVDRELFSGELTEVEAHLRACPTCAADALTRLQLKRMTQAAGRRFSPRQEFRVKIAQSIDAAKRPWWGTRWAPALAAAAALVLMLVPAALWLQHLRSEQALGELADLHVSTLASANPVDVVSSDRHTVKPWFQGKLPFTFNLPELQTSPFKLIGGRLTYFQQSPGGQLLFEVGKHQISVFIFQNRAELSRLNSGSSLSKKLAFNTETWADGGLWYFVVGDASPSDIHDLSELLKSANR